jgi:hypothetical protein
MIESSTGSVVQVMRPAETFAGLAIWPWRVLDVASARNVRPTLKASGVVTNRQAIVEVSFLLLASPAGAEGPATQLLDAHRTLLENPIISGNDSNFRMVVQQLSVEELAAIFTAAQLKLSLCTNYSLQLTF